MKKYLYLMLCSGLLHSCFVNKHPYEIATTSDYEMLLSEGKYARFIIIEDSFSEALRDGLSDTEWYGNSDRRFEEKISQITDEGEKNFFKGAVYLQKELFDQALASFERAAFENEIFQVKILLLDCRQELAPDDNFDYYPAYQELYDEAPNHLMKSMIKNRYKYYRYGL